MTHVRLRDALVLAHRWAGLILTPIFLAILVSGGLLALRPISEQLSETPTDNRIELRRVVALLQSDGTADRASQIEADAASGRLTISGNDGSVAIALDDGHYLPTPPQTSDSFVTIERFHKSLLIGAGELVEIAAYLMLGLVLLGPLLSWPRLRNTVLGWHLGTGWITWPLVLMLPATAVLMTLHIGSPSLPRANPQGPPTTLPAALVQAAPENARIEQLSLRRFRGGSVLISLREGTQQQVWVVAGDTVTPLDPKANWPKQLHEGTWAGAWSGFLNLVGAIALLLLTGTGAWSWLQRQRQQRQRSGSREAEWLVAYASQTGTATRLATATSELLQRAGYSVMLASLGTLSPNELQTFGKSLLIVATTGEGDAPDSCRGLLKRLESARLDGMQFSLLALGDRRYPHFCGGGQTVFDALAAAGAIAVMPMQTADGDPGPAWQQWIAAIEAHHGIALRADTKLSFGNTSAVLRLKRREVLTHTSDAEIQESNGLTFVSEVPLTFRPGDLLMVQPAEQIPPRCYSVGASSRANPREIQLTVSRVHWQDADGTTHYGKASDLLCRQLAPGDSLNVEIHPHPQFNPPDDAADPIVMVAAGCGIAPFIGFLAERATTSAPGQSWLMFGNRKHEGDFLYREQLQAWLASGILTRLDTAFSRDTPPTGYVTDRVREHGADLLAWMSHPRCTLYVCGRASTLGRSIDAALLDALMQREQMTQAEALAQLEHWGAEGRYRRDLFD